MFEGTDIKIHFLHYHTQEEALQKWARRLSRFNFGNFLVIGFEQNGASEETIKEFSQLPLDKKIFFTVKDYHLPYTIYTPEFRKLKSLPDVVKYCNPIYRHLVKYINTHNLLRISSLVNDENN